MKSEEKGLKKRIKELKKTSKGLAILKLFRWAIFFLALLIFMIIASLISSKSPQNNNPMVPNINDKTLNDKENEELPKNDTSLKVLTEEKSLELLNNLKNSNFSYKIEIKTNDNIYLYNGYKTKENDIGYKETSEGIIKYMTNRTGTYKETLSGKEPLENLYNEIIEKYRGWDNLFNALNMEYMLTNENTYHMASETQDIYLTIKDNFITNIKIVMMESEYTNFYSYEYIFKVGD